ncbi:MAG TPA: AraC family transcriptional regulator [Planctomycetota bacterium]|nr:AraC family transcriptional regulator [Planctomycetota bacterium]
MDALDLATRAVAVLNALALPPLRIGGATLRIRYWGVTPPAYWSGGAFANPCVRHQHGFVEACHALVGRGTFQSWLPDAAWPLSAGDTFVAGAGAQHRYGSDPRHHLGCCYWAFTVRAPRAGATDGEAIALRRLATARSRVLRDARVPALLEALFREALAGAPRPASLARLHECLALTLAEATPAEATPPRPAPSPAELSARAREFIAENCCRDVRVDEAARHVAVSPRALTRLLAADRGGSYAATLARARVATARRLLLDPDLPLKRAAAACGFGSAAALVRAFRRATGLTPGAYRRRSLGAGG